MKSHDLIYYAQVSDEILETVIHKAIGADTNPGIFKTIDKLLDKREVDLILGGPPCQAYSLVGRARSADSMEKDSRNHLYLQYASYLERYTPKLFVFENVLGLKSANDGLYLDDMKQVFLSKGYQMKLFTLVAKNFGVLQNRRRIIILGWKQNLNIEIPDLKCIKNNLDQSVRVLFDDLPELQAGQERERFSNYRTDSNDYLNQSHIRKDVDILTQHDARPHTDQDKEIYRIVVEKWNIKRKGMNYNDLPERLKTHRNRKSFFDRFKLVAADEAYSQTVVAHIAKDGHYYIHPDISQNRSITVREAARLQSFPDDYYFEGVKENANRTVAFKQIGNAVPPLMSELIAKEINKFL